MEQYLYFEICIICVLILLIVFVNLRQQYNMFWEEKLFCAIVWTSIFLTIFDAVWVYIEREMNDGATNLNYVSNLIYFVLTGGITYLSFLYVEYRIHEGHCESRMIACLCCIPFLIVAGGAITGFWCAMFLLSEAENGFHDGHWYAMQCLIAYGYITFGMIRTMRMARRNEKSYMRGQYRVLAAISFLPVISGIAQIAFNGFPILCVGSVVSILMIFINLQNQQISKDALTGVNNRRHLNRYLDNRIMCKHRKTKLYFILMDIDAFKEINDTFGHIVGDDAIMKLASILKEVCSMNNDFLARYGGDEFAIVCERKDCQEVENLINEIEAILAFYNKENKIAYKILVSVGYAEYGEVIMENQDQLIALADERLYEVKRKHKDRIVMEH